MKLENIKSGNNWYIKKGYIEQPNTCAKSTIEKLELGVKYVKR